MGLDSQPMMARPALDSASSSSQSQAQSMSNSQTSHRTCTTDEAVTPPPASLDGGGVDGPSAADAAAMLKRRYAPAMLAQASSGAVSHASQLHHLSAVAAAQDRLHPEPEGHSRKRRADGEVEDHRGGGSTSPVKGHARTTSAVSAASTTGSTISDLSAELKTRLSYAMVKVNHGWQGRCLDEVETLASQRASPTSSSSTVHGGTASLAGPQLPVRASPSQMYFANMEPDVLRWNPDSAAHPSPLSGKPTLGPPATIQPSLPMSAPRCNPRRNSNPRYAPTMLSHSHSASPSAESTTPMMPSPHKNVREQDAIESLLFMSSPKNSANLKHSFTPSGSPGPQPDGQHQHQHQRPPPPPPPPRTVGDRHALPSAASSRRGLPSTRPPLPAKKVGSDKTPGMPPPAPSAMDLDYSSQRQQHDTSTKPTAKRHAPVHRRPAIPLASGLGHGSGHGTSRKTLRDEDIERMLDRASAELGDSSDDEEIQLPSRGRNGLARVMEA
ncbi:hypothetical protein E4U41_007299 [Claviceps citrina]|nr:hypothetical protein E4U41_007299 [Claviceps citrina]